MMHDVSTIETNTAEPSRTVSHGLKSLVVLGLLGSVSAVLGLVTIGPSNDPVGMGAAHASPRHAEEPRDTDRTGYPARRAAFRCRRRAAHDL